MTATELPRVAKVDFKNEFRLLVLIAANKPLFASWRRRWKRADAKFLAAETEDERNKHTEVWSEIWREVEESFPDYSAHKLCAWIDR